jgi:peptidoglycan/xylan/chitin deacetylase (PgdA/CDA1 family)
MDKEFSWPRGKRAAISLSFDDGRTTQIDAGVPILDKHGVKATFYVTVNPVAARRAEWQKVVAGGHEIGNHSLTHPCSANFPFTKPGLESFTLNEMEEELVAADKQLHELLGVKTTTFAYPCGQKFVGRGVHTESYVPLVARRFVVGRGFRDEYWNSPRLCDLAQVFGVDMDRLRFADIRERIDGVLKDGGWLVLAGHEIAPEGRQAVRPDFLEELCAFAQDPANELWIDTVAAVGAHIASQRTAAVVSKDPV